MLAAGTLAAACGDNWHGGGGGPIDSSTAPDADHTMPDAEIDTPVATATVSGTFAVTDVTLLDPSTAAVGGIAGGSVGISWSDLTDANDGGQVIAGTSPVNGCLVTEFSPGHLPHTLLDEGPIAISDDATSPGGLLKTVGGAGGGCSFQAAFGGYVCISNTGANATVVGTDLFALTNSHSTVAYTFPGVNFGMQAPVTIAAISRAANGVVTVVTAAANNFQTGEVITIAGVTPASFDVPAGGVGPGAPIQVINATTFVYQQASTTVEVATVSGDATAPAFQIVTSAVNINGFGDATFNSGASAFPILSQLSADTVLALNSAPADNATSTAAAAANYAVLNGFTPIPKAGIANADFLGTGSIDIAKAAGGEWPAISTTVDVPGQGWTLSDSGDPTAFPSTGAVTFGCGNDTPGSSGDDTCGDGSTALVQALIVSGRATTQSVGGTCDTVTAHTCTTSSNGRQGLPCAADTDCKLFPFQMPTETAADTYVEWQCAFIGAHSATMPAAAVDAINGINPTRIETRVITAAGAILQDGLNSTNLLVGHAFVGHTDPS